MFVFVFIGNKDKILVIEKTLLKAYLQFGNITNILNNGHKNKNHILKKDYKSRYVEQNYMYC